ncbi:MAG: CPBP family intramembrane metalloprotease [Blastocatellia bacterium]|nr:CPBP family intramembrane metalloprotease [Blastocatellia bacterium]MBL8192392.1 CPBP family intramembrane metalloprotease [Blastocatellia bacterium]MBN8725591.1 CPBP family intramembrane metalloprotease [Acidobacteriota bacterium]
MNNNSLSSNKKETNAVLQVLAFLILTSIVSEIIFWPTNGLLNYLLPITQEESYISNLFWVIKQLGFRLTSLISVILVSIVCIHLFTNRNIKSLGFSSHTNYFKDYLLGCLISFAMVSLIALLQFLVGGTSYTLALAKFSLLGILLMFLMMFVAAFFEEVMFRGYPLQVLASHLSPIYATLVLSGLFAIVHLGNPNPTFFSTANTLLAGVWLSIAYFKTRSLWLATGLHLGWNFTLGAIYGLPVSGIMELSKYSFLSSQDLGKTWLTGGNYGPEGGLITTIILLLGCFLLFKINYLKISPEMQKFFPDNNQTTTEIKDTNNLDIVDKNIA